MSPAAAALGSAAHVRHRPEQTLLYQLVERHYPEFARLMALQGSPMPGYVQIETIGKRRSFVCDHGTQLTCQAMYSGVRETMQG